MLGSGSLRQIAAVWAATETPTAPPAPAAPTAPAAPKSTPSIDEGADLRRKLLPPYKVILHNDEHNGMGHVVESLRKSLPGMTLGKAVAIMWEAHTAGKALVIACPLELAELYQQRLLSFGLTATIEKE
jgi:ATP-dependent Clp protease adaptor protein ClpS